jgi:hypothetical protein
MASLVQGLEACDSLMELTLEGTMFDDAEQELGRFLRSSRSTIIRLLVVLESNPFIPGSSGSRVREPTSTSVMKLEINLRVRDGLVNCEHVTTRFFAFAYHIYHGI